MLKCYLEGLALNAKWSVDQHMVKGLNQKKQPSTSSSSNIPRKASITLSIDEFIIDSLRKDAKSKGLSLNARINEVLSKYINCYKRAEEFESCIVTSRTFSVFLEMLDEDRTVDIMKTEGTDSFISYLQHNNIPQTPESVIALAFENIAINTGVCTKCTQYTDQEGFRTIVFDHKYGIKWSRIVSKVFSSLLEKTCNIHTSVNLLPNTFSMKIRERDINSA